MGGSVGDFVGGFVGGSVGGFVGGSVGEKVGGFGTGRNDGVPLGSAVGDTTLVTINLPLLREVSGSALFHGEYGEGQQGTEVSQKSSQMHRYASKTNDPDKKIVPHVLYLLNKVLLGQGQVHEVCNVEVLVKIFHSGFSRILCGEISCQLERKRCHKIHGNGECSGGGLE